MLQIITEESAASLSLQRITRFKAVIAFHRELRIFAEKKKTKPQDQKKKIKSNQNTSPEWMQIRK